MTGIGDRGDSLSGLCQPPAGFVRGTVLGRGAFGETFLVRSADAIFVCKRLQPRTRGMADARAAFHDEARALSAIGGDGAPRLVKAGEDDEGPYLVLERAAGKPLAKGVAPGELARVARRAFAALAAVHAAPLGIVHADLSPSNVLASSARVTLVDFGLARFPGQARAPSGAFRGTITYAAPELARGDAVDARADIFALAATCFHVASGVAPRAETSAAHALLEAAEQPLDRYAETAGIAFDRATAAALARCLAFDREARPARASEVFERDS